ncbi:MAG: hypothetical protein UW73_C0027G0012 [Microgenomates group bacterium GW2011_GWB1_44_8]|nr:MAG: hypothetical protein UW73_C0027G0012 [Microgenomates group bacterium GW2011_GWB1_44_8]
MSVDLPQFPLETVPITIGVSSGAAVYFAYMLYSGHESPRKSVPLLCLCLTIGASPHLMAIIAGYFTQDLELLRYGQLGLGSYVLGFIAAFAFDKVPKPN